LRYHADRGRHAQTRIILYRLIRPLLFALDPERSHELTLDLLRRLRPIPGALALVRAMWGRRVPALPIEVMGLRFSNPVGLAAGLDKDAACVESLAAFGFGWLELGTVTPRPQPGNPRPRLFRLRRQCALINRMGFNNVGVEAFCANLRAGRPPCPLGINLGKNRDTPIERALDDYVSGLRMVYQLADYVAVNVSSPNTPGLRGLQEGGNLEQLLEGLARERSALADRHGRRVPLALKIAPDLDDTQIDEIARLLLAQRFDAVIATNTTTSRAGVAGEPSIHENGGLSGRPLRDRSTVVIGRLYRQLQGQIPIIGVGGIESADDAWNKLVAGADLVQVYTALIYRGPALVREIATGLADRVRAGGFESLPGAVKAAREPPSPAQA
jgi:dihydroorotate dehydrogenase